MPVRPSCGDALLYRYEGDVLPYDEDAGWIRGNPCDGVCHESIVNGRYVTEFVAPGDGRYNNTYLIDGIGGPPPPPSLWVEWRHRTSHPKPPCCFSCAAWMVVRFAATDDVVDMYADAVFSWSGSNGVTGLDPEELHTHRFESPDGENYTLSVDGLVYKAAHGSQSYVGTYLQMIGKGACLVEYLPVTNEWDMVRFGTLGYGEHIIASEPPGGFVDARLYPALDRFAVTFDAANYVYVNQISVALDGDPDGTPVPGVAQTRRRENDEPDTVEIILDRAIPYCQRTRFTFEDGVAVNVVEYEYAPGDTDGDGDADLADFANLTNCFAAPANPDLPAPCPVLDADASGTIDPADHAQWLAQFTGP